MNINIKVNYLHYFLRFHFIKVCKFQDHKPIIQFNSISFPLCI
jgi:hypothetical protein